MTNQTMSHHSNEIMIPHHQQHHYNKKSTASVAVTATPAPSNGKPFTPSTKQQTASTTKTPSPQVKNYGAMKTPSSPVNINSSTKGTTTSTSTASATAVPQQLQESKKTTSKSQSILMFTPPITTQTSQPQTNNTWASLFTPSPATTNFTTSNSSNSSTTTNINSNNNNNNVKNKNQASVCGDEWSFKLAKFLTKYKTDFNAISLKPRGLMNKSNYCYINSILQALIGCPPFYNLLKNLPKQPTALQTEIKTPALNAM